MTAITVRQRCNCNADRLSRFSHIWRMHPAIHVLRLSFASFQNLEQFGNSLELELILVRLKIVRLKIEIFRSA